MVTEGGFNVLFGPSSGGKTFLMLDYSLCIAYGVNWWGPAAKQSPVVFIAAEGASRTPPGRTSQCPRRYRVRPSRGAKVVKASMHEGKGRYLVSRIEVDLTGDPKAREVTVTLVKPTQPLPEKAATTTTKSTGAGGLAGGSGKAAQMLEAAEAKVAKGRSLQFPRWSWELRRRRRRLLRLRLLCAPRGRPPLGSDVDQRARRIRR
jgi:hypothetical protein